MSNTYFYNRFSSFPDFELQEMLNNPQGRDPEALSAAKLILEERSLNQTKDLKQRVLVDNSQNKDSEDTISSDLANKKTPISFSLRSIAVFLIINGLLALTHFENILNVNWTFEYVMAYQSLLIYVGSSILGGVFLFRKKELGLWFGSLAMFMIIPNFQHGSLTYINEGITSILLQIYPPIELNLSLFANKFNITWGNTSDESFFALNIVGVIGIVILEKAADFYRKQKEWPSHLH